MNPYCSRCYTIESEPVDTDAGIEVRWFKLADDGDIVTTGLDEEGEIVNLFMGIVEEDFDYDESYPLICSDCLVDIFENREGYENLDDDYPPF